MPVTSASTALGAQYSIVRCALGNASLRTARVFDTIGWPLVEFAMEVPKMTEYQRFADQERSGWSDKHIIGSYVSKFGPITDQVAQELVARISPGTKAILDLCCTYAVAKDP
jgi:hypothetical protein